MSTVYKWRGRSYGLVAQRLEAIEHTQLSERVRLSLRKAILEGGFAAGERLVEGVIARDLGVSRVPVREAIRVLANEGLVVLTPRRGAFVTQLTAEDAEEVYTLRGSLESLAFRLAAKTLTAESQTALGQLIGEMRAKASKRDVAGLSELDVRFHRAVVELAGNARLLQAWDRMIAQVGLLSGRVVNTLYADLGSVVHRHQSLLDALSSGSEDLAAQHIEEHIRSVAERIVPSLREGGGKREQV